MSVQERKKYDHHYDDLIGEYSDHHITLDKRGIPTRAISLMWNQRSVDTFLGLPFNIASYGLLLEIIAKDVNMVPDELIGNLGDTHLYLNHIEQAKEQIGRELGNKERIELAFKSIESTDGNSAALLWELSCQGKKESEIMEILNNSPRNIPTRAISLMWNQRSVDTFLGLPFNIASYGLLLEIIAKVVNMVPDELIGNLGDTHLYLNHIEQAKEQIGREPFPLPLLKHLKTDEFYKSLSEDVSLFTHLDNTDFVIENYQAHPTIKAPLSN
jgi:thymidylate synthase